MRGQGDREDRLGGSLERTMHRLGDARAVEPELFEQAVGLAVRHERPRHAEDATRGCGDTGLACLRRERAQEELTGPAVAEAVLDGDHDAVLEGGGDHLGIRRRHHAHVIDRRVDAACRELVGGIEGGPHELADCEHADGAVALADPGATARSPA